MAPGKGGDVNNFNRLLLLAVFTTAAAMIAFSQTQSKSEPQAPEKIVVDRSEVLLDAVVRDKQGRAVTNLSTKDFEIYEDGVRQQISSLRLVTRGSETRAAAPVESTQKPGNQKAETTQVTTRVPFLRRSSTPELAPENALSAVALLFDRLSTDARARAHGAALSYTRQGFAPNDLVGVFALNPSLNILQPFTTDKQLVEKAVDQAERLNSTTATLNPGQIDDSSSLNYLNAMWKRQASLAATVCSGGNAKSMSDMAELAATEMSIRTAEVFDGLERDRQGLETTTALLAIIEAMRQLPGRKAVILFGESVAVTAKVMPQFRSVISNANRAGVSIYSVDAAGLRTVSNDLEAGQALTLLGQRRTAIAGSKEDTTSLMTPGPAGNGAGPWTWDLERNEELLRRNPERILAALADETGGRFISGTNDPGARLRQVNEDLHSYYLLSYSPKNLNYDGHYRQINVRLARRGIEVRARKGYYALHESYDSPVLDYEAPALARLSGKPATDAFQSLCAAFSFPEPARPGLVPVVVEVPAGAINFLVDSAKTKYSADFVIAALIRDESGHVARKLSTHYLPSGPYDNLDAALSGNILFYKETQLEPGQYSVSAIVYDALARQSSTSAANVTVPTAEKDSLQLSSIVLVKHSEQLSSADKQTSRLLRFNEVLLYPNLGGPVSKSNDKELTLFLTAYVPPGAASVAKLTFEVLQAGRTVGQLSSELPAPDQAGRIQYASSISLDKLQPGDYEIKALVTHGATKAMRSERFTVQP